MTALPAPSPLADRWQLDPGIVYLNHGSFGACPTEVLDAQRRIRDKVEAEAVSHFVRDLFIARDNARAALAPLLGACTDDIVFLNNATFAVATVLANLVRTGGIGHGDELLVNNHEYPACLNMFRDVAARTGARIVDVTLPWPVPSAEAVADTIVNAATERTKLCLLSLVTSPTAIVMPAADIVRRLRERGVETLLDAAHGPGIVDTDLDTIGAAYSTGNLHKWLCAPKGSAFLHVRRDLQAGFRPLVLSVYDHKADAPGRLGRSRFHLDFDYMGTDDYSPVLAVPSAAEFAGSIVEGGVSGLAAHNRELCLRARDMLCKRWGTRPCVPDSMTAAMCAVPIPDQPLAIAERLDARTAAAPCVFGDPLQDALLERWKIQVPIWTPPGGMPGRRRHARISAQAYNSIEQYEYLAEAVLTELQRERDEVG